MVHGAKKEPHPERARSAQSKDAPARSRLQWMTRDQDDRRLRPPPRAVLLGASASAAARLPALARFLLGAGGFAASPRLRFSASMRLTTLLGRGATFGTTGFSPLIFCSMSSLSAD